MRELETVGEEYFQALLESDEPRAEGAIMGGLAEGHSPENLLLKIVIPAIDRMNQALVVEQEINLAQHYLSSKISETQAMRLLTKFKVPGESAGCVILGSAVGDYHGLGKKIVAGCLRAHLFTVIDLGPHVSPEQFVDAALANNAHVIGISSMMAHTATGPNGSLGVRKLLRERGLERGIKIMVGGAPFRFDRELYKHVQADGWGENGFAAVDTAKRFLKEMAS